MSEWNANTPAKGTVRTIIFYRSRGFQWTHMGHQNHLCLPSRASTSVPVAEGYY